MNFLDTSSSIIAYMGDSFISHFMTIKSIQQLLGDEPEKINLSLIKVIEKILRQANHEKQKLAVILYREAASLLSEITLKIPDPSLKRVSFNILRNFSLDILDRSSLSFSLALGTLPIELEVPDIDKNNVLDKKYPIDTTQLFNILNFSPYRKIVMGRSIIWMAKGHNDLVVFKFARDESEKKNLLNEVQWIDYLRYMGWSKYFEVPNLVNIKGNFLFSAIEYKHPFICFLVPRDYFIYPNGFGFRSKLKKHEFLEIISKNSKILGMLTSKGIIHTAVIPLFHNRIQRNRRDDGGVYLWERGGRLDRWLESSLYPNIGKSGIRDFEHIEVFDGNRRRLFREIGNQILAFMLIIGSYFRMIEPEKIGLLSDGTPVDVRHLFDDSLMKEAIYRVIKNYYLGFVGEELEKLEFKHMDYLVERMIEEMGVDRYMEEVLRVIDQEQMEEEEFKSFLIEHGYTKDQLDNLKKGEKDIILTTGPHLGAFNNRISIPELIDFVGGAAALFISSRYIREKNFLKINNNNHRQ